MVKSSLAGVAAGLLASAVTLAVISFLAEQPQPPAKSATPLADTTARDADTNAAHARTTPEIPASEPPSVGTGTASPVAPKGPDVPIDAPLPQRVAPSRPADVPASSATSADNLPASAFTPDARPKPGAGPSAPTMRDETDAPAALTRGTAVDAPVQGAAPEIPTAEAGFAPPDAPRGTPAETTLASESQTERRSTAAASAPDTNVGATADILPTTAAVQNRPDAVDSEDGSADRDGVIRSISQPDASADAQAPRGASDSGEQAPADQADPASEKQERLLSPPLPVTARTERDSSGRLVTVYRTISPDAKAAPEIVAPAEANRADSSVPEAVAPDISGNP